MELNLEQIKEIIPHRDPFLFIDKVVSCTPNEKLVAIKNVSIEEPYFEGHFPEEKVMPGVLQVEAMAQAGCIYFYFSKGLEGKKLLYYLAKTTAKFHKVVVPGDQLRIEITSKKLLPKAGFLIGQTYVGEELASEAEIGFGIKEV